MKPFIPLLRASLLLAAVTAASATDPAWWTARAVKTTAPASNLSPATIGQAKWMASQALAELQTHLSTQEYQSLQTDVAAIVNFSFPQTQAEHDNQRNVLLSGQLKAMAKPFYDHLRALNPAWVKGKMYLANSRVIEPGSSPLAFSRYPWSESAADDTNYSPATVGQLKAIFAIELENWGLPDPTDPPLPTGPVDTDGDALSDVTEAAMGTSPLLTDTDGDGVADALDLFPLDSSRWAASAYGNTDFSPPLITLAIPATATYVSGP